MDVKVDLIIGIVVFAIVVIVVATLNRGRLKSLALKAPGVSAKMVNHSPPKDTGAIPTPGVSIEKSKLKKSPITGLEGSHISVSTSDLDETEVTIREKQGRQVRPAGEHQVDPDGK